MRFEGLEGLDRTQIDKHATVGTVGASIGHVKRLVSAGAVVPDVTF